MVMYKTGEWLQVGIAVSQTLGLFIFIWYWNLDIVLKYSTDDEEVIALARTFARVMSFNIAPSLFYACLRQYFQSMGIMWPTTLVGFITIFMTAMGNYLFIYGIGSWKGLGFAGSPLATVVAAWFQPFLLVMITIVWKKYHQRAWEGWTMEAFTLDR